MFRTIIGLVAASAVILASSPAVAGGYGGSGRPRTKLTLSYQADAGYAAAVKLECGPVGGGHPKGAEACATLAAAGGNPEKIPPALTYCTLEYSPVDAEMTGTWRGSAVLWRHRYGNSCEMRRATGVLFAF